MRSLNSGKFRSEVEIFVLSIVMVIAETRIVGASSEKGCLKVMYTGSNLGVSVVHGQRSGTIGLFE